MPELCFDATAPGARSIPRSAFAVAGPVNGANRSFIWTRDQWELFPHAGKIGYNTTGDPELGTMLDVERFDATPDHIAAWWDNRHAAGIDELIVYGSRDVQAAITAALAGRPCWRCVATLDGTMRVTDLDDPAHPKERAMVQFAGAAMTGGPFDASVIWRDRLAAAIGARTSIPRSIL
jgi:hypothetical protein